METQDITYRGIAEDGRRLVVVDTETNGLSNTSDILEIAIVVLSPTSLLPIDSYSSLVQPTLYPNYVGRTDIHGITVQMLENAPTLLELRKDMVRYLHGNIIVAHNLEFDSKIITNNINRSGGIFRPGIGICTYRKMTNKKLALAARHCGIRYPRHHTALGDAMVAAALLRRYHRTWSWRIRHGKVRGAYLRWEDKKSIIKESYPR